MKSFFIHCSINPANVGQSSFMLWMQQHLLKNEEKYFRPPE